MTNTINTALIIIIITTIITTITTIISVTRLNKFSAPEIYRESGDSKLNQICSIRPASVPFLIRSPRKSHGHVGLAEVNPRPQFVHEHHPLSCRYHITN